MRSKKIAAAIAAGMIALAPLALAGCGKSNEQHRAEYQAQVEKNVLQPLDDLYACTGTNGYAKPDQSRCDKIDRDAAEARAEKAAKAAEEDKIHPAVWWVGGIAALIAAFIGWAFWSEKKDEEREAERLRLLASLGDDDDDDDDDSDEDWDADDSEMVDYPDDSVPAPAQAPAPSPAPQGGSILDALKSR